MPAPPHPKPDFNAWLETLAHASGVLASEAVVRSWSILYLCSPSGPIPSVSGCPGESSRLIWPARKFLCICTNIVDAFWERIAKNAIGKAEVSRR